MRSNKIIWAHRTVYAKLFVHEFERLLVIEKNHTDELIQFLMTETVSVKYQNNDQVRETLLEFVQLISDRTSGCVNSEKYDSFYNHLLALSESTFIYKRLSSLSYLAITYGFFRAGYYFRTLFASAVKQSLGKSTNTQQIINYFAALMESQDYVGATSFMHKNERALKRKIFDFMKAFQLFSTNEYSIKLSPIKSYFSKSDQAFMALIKGKKIAIVGPAPTEDHVAEEIESYDLIVRFNYLNDESKKIPVEFGCRTDISYIRPSVFEPVKLSDYPKAFNGLKYVVVIDPNKKIQANRSQMTTKIRPTLFPYNFMLTGYPNMVQAALIDLLSFQPSEIKLFKITFSYSSKNHYNGYSMRSDDTKRIFSTHAKHDLVTQFVFVKNLLNSGVIKADRTCENILSLSANEYVSGMEKFYLNR